MLSVWSCPKFYHLVRGYYCTQAGVLGKRVTTVHRLVYLGKGLLLYTGWCTWEKKHNTAHNSEGIIKCYTVSLHICL